MSGTSVGRMIRRICSMLFRSGDRPPCMQKIFSSMMAATGKQLKQSVNVFQILMLYLRLPASFARTIQSPDRQSATDQHEDRLTLVVEAVNPVDRGALVVATKNEEVLRVLDLERQEQADRFQTLFATIHVVAKEQVV